MQRGEVIERLAALATALGLRRPALAPLVSEAAPVNLFEYEPLARQRVSRMAYDYVAGGAGDEITLRRNRECYDAIKLHPRVLIDVSLLETELELFGQKLPFPILLAPTAYHKLMHPEGERATARGAGAAEAAMVVSSFATTAIEDVAKAATAPLWFQLYSLPDAGVTRELVQRAEAAGCKALCVTVDTPVLGARNREERAHFKLPEGVVIENLRAVGFEARHPGGTAKLHQAVLDPRLDWKRIEEIQGLTRLPVLLKGILSPEDARLAAERGLAGVLVSNHGARNLDTAPATIEALPRVVAAVEGRIPVLVDGGVRRGSDVVKALALGAKAVLIGRPYLWALAVGGAAGVEAAIRILRSEFEMAMALCGTPSLARIDRSVLWPER
jgi:4-hydroxymandelate oxidase